MWAALQVARSPFGPELGLVPAEAGSAEGKQRASEVSAEFRGELLHAGYGPFLQRRMARLTEQEEQGGWVDEQLVLQHVGAEQEALRDLVER